jgi:hypothetical protein
MAVISGLIFGLVFAPLGGLAFGLFAGLLIGIRYEGIKIGGGGPQEFAAQSRTATS